MNTRQSILDSAKVLPSKGEALIATPLVNVTLTREQYLRLEAMFPPRATADAILAAQSLGQQQVLQALRNGFTA